MRRTLLIQAFAVLVALAVPVRAGLYNTAEPPAPLHDDLPRFLDELSKLRSFGPPDQLTVREETPQRKEYLQKVKELQAKGRLSSEEQANLGAYLIRLRKTGLGGRDYEEAVQVLETARRGDPRNFYVLANLGTVYQLTGQMDAALSCLQEAYQLAPETSPPAPPSPDRRGGLGGEVFERYQLRLLQLRMNERLRLGMAPLDELFPVRFIGPSGKWEPGKLAEDEQKKLPADALKIVQQLLVWFPEDGRLHWLLGEIANARGDIAGAYKAMDQAVYLFRLSTPELKERRQLLKEAVDRLPRSNPFEGLNPDGPAPEYSWQLGWKGWTAIGVGGLLGLGLIALQLRELRRRRARRV
jgi:tetratricopeptide (TPR) repeat protein